MARRSWEFPCSSFTAAQVRALRAAWHEAGGRVAGPDGKVQAARYGFVREMARKHKVTHQAMLNMLRRRTFKDVE